MSSRIRDVRLKGGLSVASLLLATLALASCGKKDADRPAGQVIAHIGPDDVTVPELENEFRIERVPADKRDDAATRRALSVIVVRKGIARQAINAKFDREPTIQLDTLRQKEGLLENTFLQRKISAQVAGISQADIDQYIGSHPSHFAKRVVFATEQIVVPGQQLSPAVGEATKGAKSLDEVQKQLEGMKVGGRRDKGRIDSAILPAQLFEQLQARKPDDVFFSRDGGNGVFFTVISSEPKPLAGDDASKLAKELLARETAEHVATQAAQDARAAATYEGDYAKIMKNDPASPAKPEAAK